MSRAHVTARLQGMPPGTPDIHPNIAEAYRRGIERLTEVPSHSDDALQAADTIRKIIDRLMVTPGKKQGRCTITIQGALGTILACRPCGLVGGGATCLDSRLLTKVVLC